MSCVNRSTLDLYKLCTVVKNLHIKSAGVCVLFIKMARGKKINSDKNKLEKGDLDFFFKFCQRLRKCFK